MQTQSRCRQVPRRRSGVSDLSAPETSGGLHSDPLAGNCTPFRLSTQRADGTVCRYLICGFLPIIKYHIMRGVARWWGEKCGEKAARPSQPPAATALPEGEPSKAASWVSVFLLGIADQIVQHAAAVDPFHKPEMDRFRLARRAAAWYTGFSILYVVCMY